MHERTGQGNSRGIRLPERPASLLRPAEDRGGGRTRRGQAPRRLGASPRFVRACKRRPSPRESPMADRGTRRPFRPHPVTALPRDPRSAIGPRSSVIGDPSGEAPSLSLGVSVASRERVAASARSGAVAVGRGPPAGRGEAAGAALGLFRRDVTLLAARGRLATGPHRAGGRPLDGAGPPARRVRFARASGRSRARAFRRAGDSIGRDGRSSSRAAGRFPPRLRRGPGDPCRRSGLRDSAPGGGALGSFRGDSSLAEGGGGSWGTAAGGTSEAPDGPHGGGPGAGRRASGPARRSGPPHLPPGVRVPAGARRSGRDPSPCGASGGPPGAGSGTHPAAISYRISGAVEERVVERRPVGRGGEVGPGAGVQFRRLDRGESVALGEDQRERPGKHSSLSGTSDSSQLIRRRSPSRWGRIGATMEQSARGTSPGISAWHEA